MPLPGFHPAVATWFERTFGEPTPPQVEGWPAIREGRHTLIASPTGSGKTLAAFLCAIDDLVQRGPGAKAWRIASAFSIVSPLKALSNDIDKNLQAPLEGIRGTLEELGYGDVDIRTAVRTGDTPSHMRTKMVKKPPHIFVTTPESLYILLTSEGGRRMLSDVRTVIVDEIHAVVTNKRGAHLALSLERLEALVGRDITRIGLSATQNPIEDVAHFLVGARSSDADEDAAPDCRIVDVGHQREMDVGRRAPRLPARNRDVPRSVGGDLREAGGADRRASHDVDLRQYPAPGRARHPAPERAHRRRRDHLASRQPRPKAPARCRTAT